MRNRSPHMKCADYFVQLIAGKRQQRNHPRALDRDGQFALVFSAGAGVATRQDFATVRNKLPQATGVFVVNDDVLFRAKLANLLFRLAEFA